MGCHLEAPAIAAAMPPTPSPALRYHTGRCSSCQCRSSPLALMKGPPAWTSAPKQKTACDGGQMLWRGNATRLLHLASARYESNATPLKDLSGSSPMQLGAVRDLLSPTRRPHCCPVPCRPCSPSLQVLAYPMPSRCSVTACLSFAHPTHKSLHHPGALSSKGRSSLLGEALRIRW